MQVELPPTLSKLQRMSVNPNQIPTLDAYLARNSALEIGRRFVLGMPFYFVMGMVVVLGTPILSDFPVWAGALAISLGALLIVTIRLCFGFEHRYNRSGEVAVKQFTILLVVQCLIWAALVVMIIVQYGLSNEAALTLFITAGFSAGGVRYLAVRPRIVLIYLAVLHGPIFIAVLLVDGMAQLPYLIAIVAYTAFLIKEGMHIYRLYVQHLRDQLDLKALVRKADRASQGKSEFLANMSHELRTLMNGVVGVNDLLMDTELSDQQYEYGQTIQNSANSLLNILNDMLDLSKIEAGALELDLADFNIRKLLDETTSMMAWMAGQSDIEYVCAIDPSVPSRLCGDVNRLRQILINLISNAIKFTPEGYVSIWVECEASVHQRDVLKVTVADTGIGIPEDKINNLFTPFEQVETSITREYSGTGLGLGICKHLIKMMDGEIQVDSLEGVGSTFVFTVALHKASSSEVDEAETTAPVFEDSRVLVADANAPSREWLRILLERAGCRPQLVAEKDAMYAAIDGAAEENDPYRLIIVDFRLVAETLDDLESRLEEAPSSVDTVLACMVPLGTKFRGHESQVITLAKPVKEDLLRRCLSASLLDDIRSDSDLSHQEGQTRRTHPKKAHISHFRILLAEDDDLSRKVASGILENAGYFVDAVTNGRQAIEALESVNYDLVFMDCMMPEMDGYAATRAIRAPGSRVINPSVHIVALTALALEGDRAKCLAAGMDDYMIKPVSVVKLIRVIEQSLGETAPVEQSVTHKELGLTVDEQILDEIGIQPYLNWDRPQLKKIIRHFLDTGPQQIAKLHEALLSEDIDLLQILGHQARGSASILVASELSARASALEEAAKEGDLDLSTELTPKLTQELQRLLNALAGSGIQAKDASMISKGSKLQHQLPG